MPNWSPNWADVRFDHAAAAAAAAECRRVAALLSRTTSDRADLADHARQEWSGPFRDDFDTDLDRLAGRAERLIERLRRLADDIDAASEAARREQAAREAARAQWHREAEAEREAAATRAGAPS